MKGQAHPGDAIHFTVEQEAEALTIQVTPRRFRNISEDASALRRERTASSTETKPRSKAEECPAGRLRGTIRALVWCGPGCSVRSPSIGRHHHLFRRHAHESSPSMRNANVNFRRFGIEQAFQVGNVFIARRTNELKHVNAGPSVVLLQQLSKRCWIHMSAQSNNGTSPSTTYCPHRRSWDWQIYRRSSSRGTRVSP